MSGAPPVSPDKTFVYTLTLATARGSAWSGKFTFDPTLVDIANILRLEEIDESHLASRANLIWLLELIRHIEDGSCWSVRSTPYRIKVAGVDIGTIFRVKEEAYQLCK
jgi:hypothetical protein